MLLPTKVALSCLRRTAAINAAMTTRGMQQLGLAYVLAPALRYLYPDADARAKAFARYAGHNNTHVFMLPCYAGLLLNMEYQLANGRMPESYITNLRQALATTLSALGDGFFSGAVRTLWALLCICFILYGHSIAACILTIFLLVMQLLFRIYGFFYCLEHGINALQWLRKVKLASCTGYIKIINALLTGLTMWLMLSRGVNNWPWLAQAGILFFIPFASCLVGRLHIPRTLIWIAALTLFVLIDEEVLHFFHP